MKFLDEYRDTEIARHLLERIRARATRRWVLMEVCGGQTHTLVRTGLDELLSDSVELVHGPGCPVCVTPLSVIDHALELARRPGVTLCSFGDMLRVPGSRDDLLRARAAGADVRVVYSPLDAVEIARAEPDRTVVFFAVGFETTAPANAMAVHRAAQLRLDNFTELVAHVLVPPAMVAILSAPGNRVQGFLAPGHVCTVMGWGEYAPITTGYDVPIVITGFEPVDLLEGVAMAVEQLETGRAELENQYVRAVRPNGNPPAQEIVDEVFEPCDRAWRGIGVLPESGLRLRETYCSFDAGRRFPARDDPVVESERCIAGLVLQGRARPDECPAFGLECTPEHPLGAPMVSSEGACAAYRLAGRVAASGAT
ncbi:MAG: hydrogenase formation protein HypD [Acidimicrobiia bacterium]